VAVSVVVVARNEKDHIQVCLRSLCAQVPEDLVGEILVIDNNSTDGTQDLVRDFAKNFQSDLICLVENSENNLGRARAQAVELAKFEKVAFIDADCVAPPNWLKKLTQGFEFHAKNNPKLAGVGGMNRPPYGFTKFYDALFVMRKNFFGHLNSPQSRPYKKDCLVDHIPATNVLFERKNLLAVGNFSKEFESVCEDLEMGFRLRKAVRQLYMLDNCAVVHFTDSTWKGLWRRIFRFGWGQFEVLKCHPGSWCLRWVLPLVFIFVMLCSFFSFFGQWTPFLAVVSTRTPVVFFIFLVFTNDHRFTDAFENSGNYRTRRLHEK